MLRQLPKGLSTKSLLLALPWLAVWWLGAYLGQRELARPFEWGLLVGGLLAFDPRVLLLRELFGTLLEVPEFRELRKFWEVTLPQLQGRPRRQGYFRMFLRHSIAVPVLVGGLTFVFYRALGSEPDFLTGFLISYGMVIVAVWVVLLRVMGERGREGQPPGARSQL